MDPALPAEDPERQRLVKEIELQASSRHVVALTTSALLNVVGVPVPVPFVSCPAFPEVVISLGGMSCYISRVLLRPIDDLDPPTPRPFSLVSRL